MSSEENTEFFVVSFVQKNGTLHKAMVEGATASIEDLVQCVEDGVPYGDLEGLGLYVQWTLDVETFERDTVAYNEEVLSRSEKQANEARFDFRLMNANLREEIIWDWCPLWRILIANEAVLYRVPPLPWSHDGTYRPPAPMMQPVSYFFFFFSLLALSYARRVLASGSPVTCEER